MKETNHRKYLRYIGKVFRRLRLDLIAIDRMLLEGVAQVALQLTGHSCYTKIPKKQEEVPEKKMRQRLRTKIA